MFKIIFIVMSWILVGFISWMFLILSYLRKSEYDYNVKKVTEIGEALVVVILSGWFAPIIILLCCMTYKFESQKYNFYELVYDVLYKIANIGVNKKKKRMDQIEMKLYKLCSYLSYRLKYESTYLELKHHLNQVLKNKKGSLVNYTTKYDRGIGKSVSVARLSAKYDIPVFVKNNMCKRFIEEYVPKYLPQYFKKRKPKAIVVGSEYLKCHRYEVGLIDEPLSLNDLNNIETYYCSRLVGYVKE